MLTSPIGRIHGMSVQPEADLVRRRFTVDEYEQMGHVGILREDDRVELLEGEIVRMTPIGPTHASVVDRLTRLLVQSLGDRAIVRVQNPIRLGHHSEPQPDLVVARHRDDFYATRHPDAADALLIIEVSDSSLAIDRGVKVPLYGRAGVTEVWLVDVDHRRIIAHRWPTDTGYAEGITAGRDQVVTPAALPDLSLRVRDITS